MPPLLNPPKLPISLKKNSSDQNLNQLKITARFDGASLNPELDDQMFAFEMSDEQTRALLDRARDAVFSTLRREYPCDSTDDS